MGMMNKQVGLLEYVLVKLEINYLKRINTEKNKVMRI